MDVYDGQEKTPELAVTVDGQSLVRDVDFSVTYVLNGVTVSQIKEAGIYTIIATGKRIYKDSLSTTYIVEGGTISTTTISPPNECVVFKRSDGAPKIYLQNGSTRLVKDTDYTITHTIDYVALTGTATVVGIGNYGGVTIRTYMLVLLDPKAGMYMAIYN